MRNPTPRPVLDTTALDAEHAALVEAGYYFVTNVEREAEAVAHRGTRYAREQHRCKDVQIHDHAYNGQGKLIPNYVSVWGRRSVPTPAPPAPLKEVSHG